MSDTYIHGTDPSEQERLAALNRLTNAEFVRFLDVRPQMTVLEVGSGLGLLAVDVASAAEGVHVIGVEQSTDQIAAAAQHPAVAFIRGDAHTLEFSDQRFDLVYARYLLEHVVDPQRVVEEMARVARVGGRVAACENDITLMRVDPPCPAFDEVWVDFGRYQASLGADGTIGRRLYRLFRAAGLSNVELSVQPELHWFGAPGFVPWIVNLIGNIESARRGMVDAGFATASRIDRAIDQLRAIATREDASAVFTWNRAMAVKRG